MWTYGAEGGVVPSPDGHYPQAESPPTAGLPSGLLESVKLCLPQVCHVLRQAQELLSLKATKAKSRKQK